MHGVAEHGVFHGKKRPFIERDLPALIGSTRPLLVNIGDDVLVVLVDAILKLKATTFDGHQR